MASKTALSAFICASFVDINDNIYSLEKKLCFAKQKSVVFQEDDYENVCKILSIKETDQTKYLINISKGEKINLEEYTTGNNYEKSFQEIIKKQIPITIFFGLNDSNLVSFILIQIDGLKLEDRDTINKISNMFSAYCFSKCVHIPKSSDNSKYIDSMCTFFSNELNDIGKLETRKTYWKIISDEFFTEKKEELFNMIVNFIKTNFSIEIKNINIIQSLKYFYLSYESQYHTLIESIFGQLMDSYKINPSEIKQILEMENKSLRKRLKSCDNFLKILE